jgi:hypothetical protein
MADVFLPGERADARREGIVARSGGVLDAGVERSDTIDAEHLKLCRGLRRKRQSHSA